jgi:hypothetical protein
MAISEILATIDQEIAQLQQARALLSGGAVAAPKKKVGRPRKIVVAPKKAAVELRPSPRNPRNPQNSRKRRRETSHPRGGNASPRQSKSAGRRRKLPQPSNWQPALWN